MCWLSLQFWNGPVSQRTQGSHRLQSSLMVSCLPYQVSPAAQSIKATDFSWNLKTVMWERTRLFKLETPIVSLVLQRICTRTTSPFVFACCSLIPECPKPDRVLTFPNLVIIGHTVSHCDLCQMTEYKPSIPLTHHLVRNQLICKFLNLLNQLNLWNGLNLWNKQMFEINHNFQINQIFEKKLNL